MSAITTLGVDNLSLRGAGTEYNRLSRFFRTRAEAQAAINSGDWTPEPGVANACLTADEGVLTWNADTSVLENADDATREYINTQIANLVGDAPALLDQLNEIADAIGDDADFITTINAKIDTDVATERARAEAAEQTLTTDLATERTRAIGVEDGLTAAIADIQDGYDFTGKITAPATDNVIPFLYADQAAFPAAADVHGAVAHSHADGAIYFAHAGAWHKLANDVDVIANATDLATETNRAVTAEAALDARLDTLELDPTTATAVAAVQADVDQNETDSDAADAALSARLDVLEADPTTKAYVDAEVAGLIDSAPGALDTLNELAAAMGDDANFAATVSNQIAAVETEIDTARTNIYTALGQTESAQAMGTFTGGTLSDNTTVRALFQELETATELRATIDAPSFTGDVTLGNGAFYKASNERLGLGTTSPGGRLHVYDTGGVHAIFQRTGGSSKLLVKNNTTDDGITIQAQVNGPNACRFEGYGTSAGFRFQTNNGGTVTDRLHIDHAEVTADVTLNAAAGFQLAGVDLTATAAELNATEGRLDALEADATTATAVAAVQADVDQNEADADAAIALKADIASPTFTGTPSAPTAGAGTNTTQLATTAFVTTAVANVIDSAPGALDTLNELAAALGDDANFATTITNSIAAVQSDVDQNELDADNAIALKLDASAVSTFGGTLIDDADAAAARTTLGVDAAGTDNSTDVTLAGHDYITISGQEITANHIDLTDDVTGILPISNGGTGAGTAANALIALGLTATAAELNALDGITATVTELNYVDGVTSSIQDQLDAIQADVNQNESDADTAIAANEVHVDNLVSLSGVAKDQVHLSTFTGSTIVDNRTVKAALQDLETAVETKLASSAVSTFGGTLIDDADAAAARTTLGLGSAATTDSGDYATAAQGATADAALPAAGAQAALSVDHLITLSGVAEAADDLGTFTGATINDNVTVKAALQALETAQEATQADVDQNESDADAAIAAVLAGTSIPGPYNNDSDAATAGVAVGAIYKNSNGSIHWRVS